MPPLTHVPTGAAWRFLAKVAARSGAPQMEVERNASSRSWAPPIRHHSSRKEAGFWEKLEHWLHSSTVHNAVIALLLMDMALVLTGGVLEAQYLVSEIQDYEAFVEACTADTSDSDPRLLGALDRTAVKATRAGFFSARRLAGDEDVDCADPHFGDHSLHDIERVLVSCSLGILSAFFLENMLLFLCEGCSFLFNPLYMIDISVVTISIILECLALAGVLQNFSFVGLLVLARAWRFARVGHGVFVVNELHRQNEDQEGGHADTKTAWADG